MRNLVLILMIIFSASAIAYQNDCVEVRILDSTMAQTFQDWENSGGRAETDGAIIDGCLILLDPDNTLRCHVSPASQDLCRAFGDI